MKSSSPAQRHRPRAQTRSFRPEAEGARAAGALGRWSRSSAFGGKGLPSRCLARQDTRAARRSSGQKSNSVLMDMLSVNGCQGCGLCLMMRARWPDEFDAPKSMGKSVTIDRGVVTREPRAAGSQTAQRFLTIHQQSQFSCAAQRAALLLTPTCGATTLHHAEPAFQSAESALPVQNRPTSGACAVLAPTRC